MLVLICVRFNFWQVLLAALAAVQISQASWCDDMPVVGNYVVFNESCPFDSTVEVNNGVLNLTGTFNETTERYTTFYRNNYLKEGHAYKLRLFTISGFGVLHLKFLNLTQGCVNAFANGILKREGGAIRISGKYAAAHLVDTVLYKNEAVFGGAVHVSNFANFTISGKNSLIASNLAHVGKPRGGGVYCNYGANCVIRDGATIDSNDGNYGSGLFCSGGHDDDTLLDGYMNTTCTCNNAVISRNTGTRGGGVFCSEGAHCIFTNGTSIRNNTATNSGGGGLFCKNSFVKTPNPDIPRNTKCIVTEHSYVEGNSATSGQGGGIKCVGTLDTWPAYTECTVTNYSSVRWNDVRTTDTHGGGYLYQGTTQVDLPCLILRELKATGQNGGQV